MIEEMDATQAAEYLGLKTRQFRAYLSEGLIARESKVVNGKRKDMFTREALDEFKASRARGVKRVKTPEVIPAGETLPAPVETAVAKTAKPAPDADAFAEQIGNAVGRAVSDALTSQKQQGMKSLAELEKQDFLTKEEAAQLLGGRIKESAVQRLIDAGELAAWRGETLPGKPWRGWRTTPGAVRAYSAKFKK